MLVSTMYIIIIQKKTEPTDQVFQHYPYKINKQAQNL